MKKATGTFVPAAFATMADIFSNLASKVIFAVIEFTVVADNDGVFFAGCIRSCDTVRAAQTVQLKLFIGNSSFGVQLQFGERLGNCLNCAVII